jgi:hypothetical protein
MKGHPVLVGMCLAVSLLASDNVFAQADWTKRTPSVSPPGRSAAAMSQLGTGVVLFGGVATASNFSTTLLDDTWVWNGTTWAQITSFGALGTGPHPRARAYAVMAFDPNANQLVLFGGVDANENALSDTWVLVQGTSQQHTYYEWSRVTTAGPPPRADATLTFDPSSHRLVLTSGINASSGRLDDTWTFDPTTRTWSLVTNSGPTPLRDSAAMAECAIDAQHPADRVLLFGGFQSVSPFLLGDSWVFRTSQFSVLDWGQVTPATSPSARFTHAMAYYPISNEVVLYGGGNGSGVAFSDTWNGFCGTWTQATPTHNPGPRQSMTLAYSAAKFNLVMFGGQKEIGPFNFQDSNETWTWGRRAACLPTDGAELPVGSTVTCQFDQIDGVEFGGWVGAGFAPPVRSGLMTTFHTEAPGTASITAQWTDASGPHIQTYNYIVTRPHR